MSISLIHRLRHIPLAFVDVETNGCSAALGDRVIEIGVCRIENGAIAVQYEQLIDPRRKISPKITAVTGITPAMCAGQPTFAQALPAILPLLEDAVVVGHNVRFDLSFLYHELERAHQETSVTLGKLPVLDTLKMARKRFGRGGNALGVLSRRLGITPDIAHRALPDARTTFRVFEELISICGGWDLTLADAFVNQGGPMHLQAPEPVPVLQLSDLVRV